MSEKETRSTPLVLNKGDTVYSIEWRRLYWEVIEYRVEEFDLLRCQLRSKTGGREYHRNTWNQGAHKRYFLDKEEATAAMQARVARDGIDIIMFVVAAERMLIGDEPVATFGQVEDAMQWTEERIKTLAEEAGRDFCDELMCRPTLRDGAILNLPCRFSYAGDFRHTIYMVKHHKEKEGNQ